MLHVYLYNTVNINTFVGARCLFTTKGRVASVTTFMACCDVLEISNPTWAIFENVQAIDRESANDECLCLCVLVRCAVPLTTWQPLVWLSQADQLGPLSPRDRCQRLRLSDLSSGRRMVWAAAVPSQSILGMFKPECSRCCYLCKYFLPERQVSSSEDVHKAPSPGVTAVFLKALAFQLAFCFTAYRSISCFCFTAQDRFLLADDDPAVTSYLQTLQEEREKQRAKEAERPSEKNPSWISLHMSLAE